LGKRAIIILSLLLLSCSKEKVEIYCNKIYSPVCANGTLYANACLAEKAGHKNQDIERAIEVIRGEYTCKTKLN
jgi:hypothetical protein